ncbi:MAG TPA: hypothetical protein VGD35_12265 [Chitinophaga sp.]
MAKQNGIFKFTGKLDNVIGYRRNGVWCVRSMPEKVRQTAATKQASQRFGIASRKGKLIRRAVRPYLDTHYDGTIINRLNSVLIQAGSHNLQGIQGFQFNRVTGLEKIITLAPQLMEDGHVHIPAQELPLLGKATHLEITLITARVNFAEKRVVDVNTDLKVFELDEPFNGADLHAPVPGKGTLIVIVQARTCQSCNGKLYPIGGRKYSAANIIAIVPPALPIHSPAAKKVKRRRPVYPTPAQHSAFLKEKMLQPVSRYQLE